MKTCCFCPQGGDKAIRVLMELSTLCAVGTEQGVSVLPEGPGEVPQPSWSHLTQVLSSLAFNIWKKVRGREMSIAGSENSLC